MKIEVGRYYEDKDGNVGGPARLWNSLVEHPYDLDGLHSADFDCTRLFREDGTSAYGAALAYEVASPGFIVEDGKHYVTADGRTVGPMVADVHEKDVFRSAGKEVKGILHSGKELPFEQVWGIDGKPLSMTKYEHGHIIVRAVSIEPVAAVEVKADPKPVVVKVGGYYRAKNGVVVGPMVHTTSGKNFKCENKAITQHENDNVSQIWHPDGSVFAVCREEEEHVLIEDVTSEYAKLMVFEDGNFRINADQFVVTGPKTVDNITLRLTADTSELNEFVASFTKVVANHERERGQLQATVEELTLANRALHELVDEANTQAVAFKEAFNVAAEGEARHRANERSLASKLVVKQGEFARLARIADEQRMAIDCLCDHIEDRDARIAWLEGKLGRTKAWCERFRKALVITEEFAKEAISERDALAQKSFAQDIKDEWACFDAKQKAKKDVKKGFAAIVVTAVIAALATAALVV